MALVVALGGASYAAFKLPAGVVGTPQLRDKAVTSSKLAPGAVLNRDLSARAVGERNLASGAVTSAQLRNRSVTARKLAPGAITAAAVAAGAGVSVTYHYGSVVLPAGQRLPAYVVCPLGTTVVGGGATSDGTSVTINDSAPFNSAADAWTGGVSDSWGVYATNTDTTQSHTLGIYAVCLATAR